MTGVMGVGIGQFTLPGNNAGFCAAILQKNGGQTPLRLESLTYVRPFDRETAPQPPQQPLVVNLLMQLRAYYDQSNTYLRNQAALNIQLTNQLRQVLALSGGPVRAQAGAIQRAVRENLYREGEFQRALDSLAREVKKNGNRSPELTVRLPGPVSDTGRRQLRPMGAISRTPQQEIPVLRAPVFPKGEAAPLTQRAQGTDTGSRRQAEALKVYRSPAVEGGQDAAHSALAKDVPQSRKGRRKNAAEMPEAKSSRNAGQAGPAKGQKTTQTTEGVSPVKSRAKGRTAQITQTPSASEQKKRQTSQAAAPARLQERERTAGMTQASPVTGQETAQATQVPLPAKLLKAGAMETAAHAEQHLPTVQPFPVWRAAEPARGDGIPPVFRLPAWRANGAEAERITPAGRIALAAFWRQPLRLVGGTQFLHSVSSVVRNLVIPHVLPGNDRFPGDSAISPQRQSASGESIFYAPGTAVPLTNRRVTSFENSILWRQAVKRSSISKISSAILPGEAKEPGGGGGETAALRHVVLPLGDTVLPHIGLVAPEGAVRLPGASSAAHSGIGTTVPLVTPSAIFKGGFPPVPGSTALAGVRMAVLPRVPFSQHTGLAGRLSALGKGRERIIGGALVLRQFQRRGETAAAGGSLADFGRQSPVIPQMRAADAAGELAVWVLPSGRAVFSGSMAKQMAVPPALTGSPSEHLTGGRFSGIPSIAPRLQKIFPSTVRLAERREQLVWAPGSLNLPDGIQNVPLRRGLFPLQRTANFTTGAIPGTAARISRETSHLRMPLREGPQRGISVLPPRQVLIGSNERQNRSAGGGMGIFPLLLGGNFELRGQSLSAAVPTEAADIGGHLIQVQRAVRGVLDGGNRGAAIAIHRARQVSAALSSLETQADQLRQQAVPSLKFYITTPAARFVASSKDYAAKGQFTPLLRAAGQPGAAALPDTPGRGTQNYPLRAQNEPQMIYRQPERRPDSSAQGETGADSGEAVLQAQTVSPARVAAMNAAYSYPPGGGTGRDPAHPTAELTAEQEERITQRLLEDINYNRMASEVLDRVERRLRAERRKFGR